MARVSKRRNGISPLRYLILLTFLSFGVSFAGLGEPVSAQADQGETDTQQSAEEVPGEDQSQLQGKKQQADSLYVYPQKRSSRFTWEKIVSLPGDVLFLPFEITFELIENSVAYIDDTKLVAKVLDILTSDDGRRGLRPYYSSQAGAGVKLFQKGLLTENSKLTFTLAAGFRERRRYEMRMKQVQFPGAAITSDYRIRYQFLSDESFYGIGPDARKSDRSNFAHEQVTLSAAFTGHLSKVWSINTLFGFEQNEILRGRDKRYPSTEELHTGEDLPGLDVRAQIAEFQLELQGDSRNHPGHPTGGYEILLTGNLFQQIDDDHFGGWKVKADLTRYIHLFYNRVVILRMAGEMTEPLEDRDVPFYHLSELGRQETIRGFRRGRFRDLDMILGSLEYRYPVWFNIDMALFVDAGRVSPDIFNEFSVRDLEVGYGFGLRLRGEDDLISKIEVGKSSEEIRFYFVLNPGL